MNLYDLKEAGKDYIVLTDGTTDVKITFADREPEIEYLSPTKEEQAGFLKTAKCQIGLEFPIVPFDKTKNINIFLDHEIQSFGLLRSIPFPFTVASIQVK